MIVVGWVEGGFVEFGVVGFEAGQAFESSVRLFGDLGWGMPALLVNLLHSGFQLGLALLLLLDPIQAIDLLCLFEVLSQGEPRVLQGLAG